MNKTYLNYKLVNKQDPGSGHGSSFRLCKSRKLCAAMCFGEKW